MVNVQVIANHTCLRLKDDFGRINNEQIIIYGRSGFGKGLSSEKIAEAFWKMGYIVLVIADPKNEIEYGFQMFKPIERYHYDELKKVGKVIEEKKVKLYHPFTFNIPKNEFLPEINFFTFSLKDLRRKDWSLLAETEMETESIRILIQASQNITKEDGLYGFIHLVYSMIEGRRQGKKLRYDSKNFLLPIKSGTSKSTTEISNYLQPFKKDYFLAKDNCLFKLNWKDILTDQEHYHVFFTKWINEEKLKDFVVSTILNQIIQNKDILRKPIVVVIPEIRILTPFRPEGHKKFLANSIKNSLSMMRSSGRGMSSILDTQVFSGVDEDVRNSATLSLFGELAPSDYERVVKTMNFKREQKENLQNLFRKCSYLPYGSEVKPDGGSFTIFPPSSAHKEEKSNFFDEYKKHFPERLINYNNLIEVMEKINEEEVNKFKDKIKREERIEKERQELLKKEREINKSENKKIIKIQSKVNELKEKNKEDKMIEIFKFKTEHPESSWRDVGRNCNCDYKTAQKYYYNYLKKQEEKIELLKDS